MYSKNGGRKRMRTKSLRRRHVLCDALLSTTVEMASVAVERGDGRWTLTLGKRSVVYTLLVFSGDWPQYANYPFLVGAIGSVFTGFTF